MIALISAFVVAFHTRRILATGFLILCCFNLLVALWPSTVQNAESGDTTFSPALLVYGTLQVVAGSVAGSKSSSSLSPSPLLCFSDASVKQSWFMAVQTLMLTLTSFAYVAPSAKTASVTACLLNAAELAVLYTVYTKHKSIGATAPMHSSFATYMSLVFALCIVAPWSWFLLQFVTQDRLLASAVACFMLILLSLILSVQWHARTPHTAEENTPFVIDGDHEELNDRSASANV